MTRGLPSYIDAIRRKLLGLGALVEEHVHRSVTALYESDIVAAGALSAADADVDALEIEVEQLCLEVLRTESMQADVLRHLVAALKVNADLERIGDLAANIARAVQDFGQRDTFLLPGELTQMTSAMADMLRDSLDAYTSLDGRLARSVLRADGEVDVLNRRIYDHVRSELPRQPDMAVHLINLLGVARHLERIADYATNIAENVIFIVEGRIVRHEHGEQS